MRLMFCPFFPMMNRWSQAGAITSPTITLLACQTHKCPLNLPTPHCLLISLYLLNMYLLTLAYTCVRAGPNLSGSPLRMMVSDAESRGGISTDTPVFSKISCRVLPFGPTMYLCCDFFTSTEIVVVFRF